MGHLDATNVSFAAHGSPSQLSPSSSSSSQRKLSSATISGGGDDDEGSVVDQLGQTFNDRCLGKTIIHKFLSYKDLFLFPNNRNKAKIFFFCKNALK